MQLSYLEAIWSLWEFLLNFVMWDLSSPWSGTYFSYSWDTIPDGLTLWHCWWLREVVLGSCLLFYPVNCSHLDLPEFSTCLLNSLRPQSLIWVSPLALQPGNCLKVESWDNHKAHFVCFPPLRDCYLVLSVVQCLEIIFYMLSSVLIF